MSVFGNYPLDQIREIYPDLKDDEVELRDDSDGNGVYIFAWHYGGPEPTSDQLMAVKQQVIDRMALSETIESDRSTMAAEWAALSDNGLGYIEGPYQHVFDMIVHHLDKTEKSIETRVDLALAALDAHAIPTAEIAGDPVKSATFDAVKAQFRAKIEALRS